MCCSACCNECCRITSAPRTKTLPICKECHTAFAVCYSVLRCVLQCVESVEVTHIASCSYVWSLLQLYWVLFATIHKVYIWRQHLRCWCILALQHTATHCNTMQLNATHCNILQHTATSCNALQRNAKQCSILQHTAAHCNTLQHTATHRNTPEMQMNTCCSVTHCNTLLHTTTHCYTHCYTLHCSAPSCTTL